MKTFRKLLGLLVVSVMIAIGLFFINSSVIVSSFSDKVSEILFLTLPVFIVLAILFYVNRALVRTVKSVRNKKPSAGEGLNL
ncbi:hypothetical protein [Flavobacterium sp. DG1-102-2]|uniref:hypothetical protein n=1 Tax=Flavobacterium sp. DG1-102-2 TaxID=3081663 RepID=UPI00294B9222|nr:hypothetical protein [Flavobacterium sp. DG1-102-2]